LFCNYSAIVDFNFQTTKTNVFMLVELDLSLF